MSRTVIHRPDRGILVQDNDGHWYFIRAEHEEAFHLWVASTEDYDMDYSGPDFESCRLDSHLSCYGFTMHGEV